MTPGHLGASRTAVDAVLRLAELPWPPRHELETELGRRALLVASRKDCIQPRQHHPAGAIWFYAILLNPLTQPGAILLDLSSHAAAFT